MADLYTPQPEVALQLLRQQGANCATGSPPAALKSCTSGHWCTWPADGASRGGVCLRAMTEAPPPVPGAAPAVAVGSGLGILLIGVFIGWMLRRPAPAAPREA